MTPLEAMNAKYASRPMKVVSDNSAFLALAAFLTTAKIDYGCTVGKWSITTTAHADKVEMMFALQNGNEHCLTLKRSGEHVMIIDRDIYLNRKWLSLWGKIPDELTACDLAISLKVGNAKSE